MDISFVIISNGKKIDKTNIVLKSIVYQNIPRYEIILCGDYNINEIPPAAKTNLTYAKNKPAAEAGFLGEMRNTGCKRAKYENVVILDDDMTLSTSWYKNLLKYREEFDILTSKVILPDGTRFWDHACYCPPDAPSPPCHGHIILEAHESDEHMYMSGGQAWMMKSRVCKQIKWDTEMSTGYRANMKNLEEYAQGKHNEDTDFSKKCRAAGFEIKHAHDLLAYHNDARYTCVGRICRMREEDRTHEWVKDLDMYKPVSEINELAASYWEQGLAPETSDILQYGLLFHFNNAMLLDSLKSLENRFGGKLSDNNWNVDGDPLYNEDIEIYKNYDCNKMPT